MGTSFHVQGYVKLSGSRKGAFGGIGGDLVATKVWQTESAPQLTSTVLKIFDGPTGLLYDRPGFKRLPFNAPKTSRSPKSKCT